MTKVLITTSLLAMVLVSGCASKPVLMGHCDHVSNGSDQNVCRKL